MNPMDDLELHVHTGYLSYFYSFHFIFKMHYTNVNL